MAAAGGGAAQNLPKDLIPGHGDDLEDGAGQFSVEIHRLVLGRGVNATVVADRPIGHVGVAANLQWGEGPPSDTQTAFQLHPTPRSKPSPEWTPHLLEWTHDTCVYPRLQVETENPQATDTCP